mmetsp:Transcript_21311/g.63685  ORF Transcript_21311/g.63685 Transcript_21311/m.63685 type:complete len:266 (-) Transcript_21311:68-865(-)
MDAVAMASSCAYLPWMMVVRPLATCLSTTFQTLVTQGHVVSTVVTPISSKCCISASVAPKAGRMTTSPSETSSKRLPPSAVFSMNSTPASLSMLLTPGLCRSSFVMCFLFSGYFSVAASASSMDRSAPQHMPYSCARRKVTAALPSPRVVSYVVAAMSSKRLLFISASIFALTAAFSSRKSPCARKKSGFEAMRLRSCFLFLTSLASKMVPFSKTLGTVVRRILAPGARRAHESGSAKKAARAAARAPRAIVFRGAGLAAASGRL